MYPVSEWLGRRMAAVAVAVLLACTGVAHAQNQLSRATHKKLTEARDLVDNDRHGDAVGMLDQLLSEIGNRDYERAITLQTLGYAHVGADNDRAAIDAFERALALDTLPDSPRITLQNMLARLYARTEQYARAKEYLDQWFGEIGKPDADDYALKANILVQLDENAEGIEAIRTAIDMSDRPREQYYRILVSLLFGDGQYAEAAETLQTMLSWWPGKKQYWSQLATVYLNLDRNEDAHAVLRLAYREGMLESEDELVRLVRVGLSVDVPAAAAELVEKEIEAGRISPDEEHWELAGHAWASAKEWTRAIEAYGRAARHGDSGKYHMRRAHMYTYLDDWEGAIEAARAALDDKGLDSPGQAHILIGRGWLELGRAEDAIAAFEAAQEFADTADRARQWRSYVKRQRVYGADRSRS